MPPKETLDQRDKKAQAYADTVPEDTVDTDYETTYRDGNLKNECCLRTSILLTFPRCRFSHSSKRSLRIKSQDSNEENLQTKGE